MGIFKRKKDELNYINEHTGFTSLGYKNIDMEYDKFLIDDKKIIQEMVSSINMDYRNKDFFESTAATFADTHIDVLEKHKERNLLTNKNIVDKLTTQINIIKAENEMIDFAHSLFDEYYKINKGGYEEWMKNY